MARYNREFLVPYLRDVFALHLAYIKLGNRCNEVESHIRYLQRGKSIPFKPDRPSYVEEATTWRKTWIVIWVFCAIMCVLGVFIAPSGVGIWVRFLGFIAAIVYGFFAYIPISSIIEGKNENERREAKYWRDMQEYKDRKKATEIDNEKLKEKIPAAQGELENYKSEKAHVSMLLNKAYRANIIPSQYRNIYVAAYLYDWFGTSMADDLDHALSMFVLEEIKAKLDTIIEKQNEMIFNQYRIASNQQKFLEQQQRHSEMMHAKLDQISASNEERNAYLHMIESNTATTAFFATADYIRRI